jgi:hypothetical protein
MFYQKPIKSENNMGSDFMENHENIHFYGKRECSRNFTINEYSFSRKRERSISGKQ